MCLDLELASVAQCIDRAQDLVVDANPCARFARLARHDRRGVMMLAMADRRGDQVKSPCGSRDEAQAVSRFQRLLATAFVLSRTGRKSMVLPALNEAMARPVRQARSIAVRAQVIHHFFN